MSYAVMRFAVTTLSLVTALGLNVSRVTRHVSRP